MNESPKVIFADEFKKHMTEVLEPLQNEFLLYPIFSLVKTERWGYDREGVNGTSASFDLGKLQDQSESIKKFIQENNLTGICTIVHMIQYYAG